MKADFRIAGFSSRDVRDFVAPFGRLASEVPSPEGLLARLEGGK